MRMPQRLRQEESGQVLVEYVLMLSISIAVIIGIQASFRGTVYKVWKQLATEISGGCSKNCIPAPEIH